MALLITSCQDEDKTTNNTINHKTMFQGYEDEQIEDELINFLGNLEKIRVDPKDPLADEVMELEPILWYMEACVNYKYGASVQPELVKIDTSYVNFTVSGTIYKLGDVQVSYDAIVDSIATFFYEFKEEDKYFLMTNISVANQTSQNITLQVISYCTLNNIIPDVNDYDWYWGLGHGQCGTNIGSPLDAADIIMRGANASIYIPAPEFYYTDSQNGFIGHTYDVVNSQNEHLGFYTSTTNMYPGPCIPESEITTFTQNFIEIGNIYQIPDKEIVNYFLMESFSTPNYSIYGLFHYGYVTYGIRHYRTSSSNELPNNPNNI